jgi:hypothetical protein
MSAAARVTNRGDVVDVDAKTNPLALHLDPFLIMHSKAIPVHRSTIIKKSP